MPEYLAPGVYVEEVSFRNKSIEGVSTTTTGFIGPARYGPLDLEPDILTSLGEFERVYGDRQQLDYAGDKLHNFAWHAVRAFFEEGGKRLYFQRVFRSLFAAEGDLAEGRYPPATFGTAQDAPLLGAQYRDGHGRASVPAGGGSGALQIRARFPGVAGNLRVRLTLRLGPNVLGGTPGQPTVGGLLDKDVVWINDINSPIDSPPGGGTLYLAESYYDAANKVDTWRFNNPALGAFATRELGVLMPNANPKNSDNARVVTLTVMVTDRQGNTDVWDSLPLDPGHIRAGSPDSVLARFAPKPSNLDQARTLPIVIEGGDSVTTGLDLLAALMNANGNLLANLGNLKSSDADRSVDMELAGGSDGQRPTFDEYEGKAEEDQNVKTGLKAFEDIEDISIVAAPGATYGYENGYRDDAATIVSLLVAHAQLMKYRIAVLDSGNDQSVAQVRAMRARYDSKYAALYYPWVRVLDPVTRQEINLPPSGFIAGIYARNDINRAVYKAPANEVINLALGFEQIINKGKQDVLNPEGVNCLRFFEGRGMLVWGARLISSDPEWKYVNLRRYFAFLERSIDRGTQWAVFEPNGEALWANVRRTIEDFLLSQWQSGALLGDKPEKAYFVKCDRTTMSQNDLDNGRLICLIGVAPLYPAEYVIFRIGQWTADRKA
jgi:phage tail sheath protein FI